MSNIVVIWDAMLDIYVFGNTDRKNPESPMPLLKVEKQEIRLWWASNVAHNITNLNWSVELISLLWDDANWKLFNKISEDKYQYNNKYIEGFVAEDNKGYMFKYKTSYYKKWKLLRSLMENAIKSNNYKGNEKDELITKFLCHLESKYKDKNIDGNSINIIDERNDFENNSKWLLNNDIIIHIS